LRYRFEMKKPNRKLVVRRETLRVIASGEFAHVVGGNDVGLLSQSGAAQCPAPAVVVKPPGG
jgi:hypothetical protein